MSEEKLPKGWVKIKLGEVLVVKNGYAYKSQDFSDSGIPVIRISNIKDGQVLTKNSVMVSEELYNESFIVKRGDILVAMSGATTGKYGIYEGNEIALQNQRVGNLQLISDQVSKKYIYYLLGVLKGQIEDVAYGAAQPNISAKMIEELEVTLAPLPDQQRIVAKLDAIFGHLDVLREKLEQIPVLLKNFRQQVLTQAVTGELTREWRAGKDLGEWEETTFGEVMEGTPKNGAYFPKDLYGSGTWIIRIDAFYDGFLKDWSKLQRVNISKSELEQYNIQIGDILINRVNSMDYLGKCMLVDKLPEPCIYESNMMRMRLQMEKITSEFTRVFLTSPIGLKELRKNAKQAVNQASINQKDVMQVQISVPCLDEQNEIVKRVDALFGLANKIDFQYQSLKAKIDQMPQAILAKAFRGELVGQEVKEYVGEAVELGMVAESNTKDTPVYSIDKLLNT